MSELVADWARSGFLIRGGTIVPWHQVQRLEATAVEELSRDQSELRRKEWEARQRSQWQQSFWRTRRGGEKKKQGGEEDESGGRSAA